MKHQNLLNVLCLIFVVSLLNACGSVPTDAPVPPTDTPVPPTATIPPIPGINVPIAVEGLQLQIASATTQESYDTGTDTLTAFSGEVLLIVEAERLSGDLGMKEIADWKAHVVDETGEERPKGLTTISDKKIIWLFAVPNTSQSFILHLPAEQIIDLNSILNTGGGGEKQEATDCSTVVGTLQLLNPINAVSNAQTSFEWEWTGEVPYGCGFEVRVWQEGDTPLGVHDAVADNLSGKVKHIEGNRYDLVTDISQAPGVQNRNGEYSWTVLFVQISPNYTDFGKQAEPAQFAFEHSND